MLKLAILHEGIGECQAIINTRLIAWDFRSDYGFDITPRTIAFYKKSLHFKREIVF